MTVPRVARRQPHVARQPSAATPPAVTRLRKWCRGRGWKPFPFQETVWRNMLDGASGLLHAPTGTGKTLAAWLGALARSHGRAATTGRDQPQSARGGPRIIWLTPLKALAADTVRALEEPLADLRGDWLDGQWRVGLRTGDTSAGERQRLRARWPDALVTTPETLSILLSLDDAHDIFAGLETVVVDEWHELLSTKRGVQTELALARLRTLAPGLCTWGLSATLANLDDAVAALVGPAGADAARLVKADIPRRLVIETLIPEPMERFPWAGHMGMRLLPQVIATIERAATTLVFTNTRSQAERWFEAIGTARPDWKATIALHHGSVDRELRTRAEDGLRRGTMKCVVATSSLDLGVDFGPVEQVLQIGSPKGIARLLQRAGRSGHAPGATGRLVCVPTHALELIECAAARTAAEAGVVEARPPLVGVVDVLAQHIVTVACSRTAGGGAVDACLLEPRRVVVAVGDRLCRAGRAGAGCLSRLRADQAAVRPLVHRQPGDCAETSHVDRHDHRRSHGGREMAAGRPARHGRRIVHLATERGGPVPVRRPTAQALPLRRPHRLGEAGPRHGEPAGAPLEWRPDAPLDAALSRRAGARAVGAGQAAGTA